MLVIDASLSLAWLLDDEVNPRADHTLVRIQFEGAIVPELWHIEIRNALLVAERRGRLATAATTGLLGGLNELPMTTDRSPDYGIALDLARTHRLSVYDALYLELASRTQSILATLDRDLERAALAEGLLMTDSQ